MSVCTTFLLVDRHSRIQTANGGLSSLDAAEASAASLFAEVDGTMDSSEFLLAFLSDFPLETFSDRSAERCHCHLSSAETNRTGTAGINPPMAARFSRLEYPRMHRFVDSAVSIDALPITAATM